MNRKGYWRWDLEGVMYVLGAFVAGYYLTHMNTSCPVVTDSKVQVVSDQVMQSSYGNPIGVITIIVLVLLMCYILKVFGFFKMLKGNDKQVKRW